VFGSTARRIVETVVVVFALLGYAFVPLGKRTAFEHTVALLRTAPAHEAAAGFVGTLEKGRALLVRALTPTPPDEAAALPLPSGAAVVPGAPKLSSDGKPRPQR
jgi:hypothetical protein